MDNLLKTLKLLPSLVTVLAGALYFYLWFRKRFWIPKYVHALSALAFIVGCYLVWFAVSQTGLENPWKAVWIVVILPALVYFFFIFYGGVEGAKHDHSEDFDQSQFDELDESVTHKTKITTKVVLFLCLFVLSCGSDKDNAVKDVLGPCVTVTCEGADGIKEMHNTTECFWYCIEYQGHEQQDLFRNYAMVEGCWRLAGEIWVGSANCP